jgi:glutaredoxin
MKYVLFVKQTCPFCVKAQEFLQEREKDFEVVNFEEGHQGVLHDIKRVFSWPTVPMIFEAGEKINFIGGYTDLVKHFDEE